MSVSSPRSLDDRHFDLGWFPERLPANVVGSSLGGCVEYRVSGFGDDDELYRRALELLRGALCGPLLREEATLVLVEHRAATRSRVRSHRGMAKRLGFPEGMDREFEVDSLRSLIVGFVSLEGSNCESAFRPLLDRSQAFAVLRARPESVVSRLGSPLDWCTVNDAARVDYMKLLPIVLNQGLGLVSIGVDTRGEFVNLRLFDARSRCDEAKREIEGG